MASRHYYLGCIDTSGRGGRDAAPCIAHQTEKRNQQGRMGDLADVEIEVGDDALRSGENGEENTAEPKCPCIGAIEKIGMPLKYFEFCCS